MWVYHPSPMSQSAIEDIENASSTVTGWKSRLGLKSVMPYKPFKQDES
jgi:hypothetical protein